jgi:hypothetical protein
MVATSGRNSGVRDFTGLVTPCTCLHCKLGKLHMRSSSSGSSSLLLHNKVGTSNSSINTHNGSTQEVQFPHQLCSFVTTVGVVTPGGQQQAAEHQQQQQQTLMGQQLL